MRALAPLLLALAAPAGAGVVTSPAPEHVAVTLYRDPARGGGAIDRNWPTGYALVTETRTISLPAGDSVLRFEDVADGMLPQSAIVTGLPGKVREKNRDARLLSPAALVEAGLARRVHLRRTNRKTGVVREEDAILRAGPGDGIVLQTAMGFEALSCSGLPERISYDGVPDGLFAKPTLSIAARAAAPVTATVRLSYLAEGFDWAANYVADIAPDLKTLDLFAWVTVANGGGASFPDAEMQAVAGRLDRTAARRPAPATEPRLELACWPNETTSTPHYPAPPPPPPPAPMMEMDMGAESIVVTAQKRAFAMAPVAAVVATQEELGDLKLYRIPERVTILAKSQKQIAMIVKPKVPFDRVYTATLDIDQDGTRALTTILRLRNEAAKGLGVPLPSGRVAIFEAAGGGTLLAGEDDMPDRAVGEKVELEVGDAPDIRLTVAADPPDAEARGRGVRLTLTNAGARAAMAEVKIPYKLTGKDTRIVREDGVDLWRASVPANGSTVLRLRLAMARRR